MINQYLHNLYFRELLQLNRTLVHGCHSHQNNIGANQVDLVSSLQIQWTHFLLCHCLVPQVECYSSLPNFPYFKVIYSTVYEAFRKRWGEKQYSNKMKKTWYINITFPRRIAVALKYSLERLHILEREYFQLMKGRWEGGDLDKEIYMNGKKVM